MNEMTMLQEQLYAVELAINELEGRRVELQMEIEARAQQDIEEEDRWERLRGMEWHLLR